MRHIRELREIHCPTRLEYLFAIIRFRHYLYYVARFEDDDQDAAGKEDRKRTKSKENNALHMNSYY